MERLTRKWDTAKSLVPAPVLYPAAEAADCGVLFFGTSTASALEAMDYLVAEGIGVDGMRLRAFPFDESVLQFIEEHKLVFLVEQNRDAQMRTLLVNELEIPPKALIPVLNFDGLPITAKFIQQSILDHLAASKVTPLDGEQAEGKQ